MDIKTYEKIVKELDFKQMLNLAVRLEKEIELTEKQLNELYNRVINDDFITSLLNQDISDLVDEMIDSE